MAWPASGQEKELKNSFELGLGVGYTSREDAEIQNLTLRWGHSFNATWGVEVGLATDSLENLDRSNRFVDISARYTFLRRDRWEVFALVGGGLLTYVDFSDSVRDELGFLSEGEDEQTWTTHLGIGGRWSLTDRLYLRPEIRYRNALSTLGYFVSADEETTDLTIALGLRF